MQATARSAVTGSRLGTVSAQSGMACAQRVRNTQPLGGEIGLGISPEISELAAAQMMALSPGVVDQDIRRLVRRRKTRPTFPFDLDVAWRP